MKKRTEPIQVYLTPKEKRDAANLANEKGLTLSAFCRTILLTCLNSQIYNKEE
jgi:hypothetical protein